MSCIEDWIEKGSTYVQIRSVVEDDRRDNDGGCPIELNPSSSTFTCSGPLLRVVASFGRVTSEETVNSLGRGLIGRRGAAGADVRPGRDIAREGEGLQAWCGGVGAGGNASAENEIVERTRPKGRRQKRRISVCKVHGIRWHAIKSARRTHLLTNDPKTTNSLSPTLLVVLETEVTVKVRLEVVIKLGISIAVADPSWTSAPVVTDCPFPNVIVASNI